MIKNLLITVLFSVFLVLMAGCNNVEKWDEKKVDATIVEKDYDSPYKEKIAHKKKSKNGKSSSTTYTYKSHPAEWDIEVEYDGLKLEIDVSSSEYNNYKIGDKVPVKLKIGYDKNNKIIEKELIEN